MVSVTNKSESCVCVCGTQRETERSCHNYTCDEQMMSKESAYSCCTWTTECVTKWNTIEENRKTVCCQRIKKECVDI